jgi:hypothetical protein
MEGPLSEELDVRSHGCRVQMVSVATGEVGKGDGRHTSSRG